MRKPIEERGESEIAKRLVVLYVKEWLKFFNNNFDKVRMCKATYVYMMKREKKYKIGIMDILRIHSLKVSKRPPIPQYSSTSEEEGGKK